MRAIERNAPVVNQSASLMPVTLSVLHALFFVASLVVVPMLAPAAKIPNPFGPDAVSRSFFLDNPGAVRVSAFLQLASAICLAALGAALSGGHKPRKESSSIAPALICRAVLAQLFCL